MMGTLTTYYFVNITVPHVTCLVQVCEVSAESQVRYELETRFQQLQSRLAAVTLETEEVRRVFSLSVFLVHMLQFRPQIRSQLHQENTRLDMFLKINTSSSCQVSKTLKATLTALLDNVCDSDCNPSPDVPSSLSHEPLGGSTAPKLILAKRRANQQETETYYFTVSNDATSSSLCRLVSLPCERRDDETVI